MVRLIEAFRRFKRPRAPADIRVYAIGDIHGRADLLEQTFRKIDQHSARYGGETGSIEIYLGDYIDRGPDGKRVIELLLDRRAGRHTIFIKGNHELFPLEVLQNPGALSDWAQIGGVETLISYGVRPSSNRIPPEYAVIARDFAARLPDAHRTFFSELRTSHVIGDFVFVHAGLRPGIALQEQAEDDLLWIRDEFLSWPHDFGKIVVHGHTPVETVDFRPNRINIDTGAYATGRLTCLVIEADRISLL